MRIPITIRLRFPGEGSSTQGKSGPKARLRSVVDGRQVDIPVPVYISEVMTEKAKRAT